MADQTQTNIMDGEWLFSRLPTWVLDTLTTEQKEAIHLAADEGKWLSHPVNIRMSLPFINRRFFVTVIGGEEKRSAERRAHERNRYPLRTAANIFFFLGVATIFYIVAIFAIAVQTSIVEL